MKKKYFKLVVLCCIFFSELSYSQDSFLDTTFGNNGKVSYDTSKGISKNAKMTKQSDGKIILITSTANSYYEVSSTISRLNTDGSIDNTFGTNGYINTINATYGSNVYNIQFSVYSIVVSDDNSIFVSFKPPYYNTLNIDHNSFFIKKFNQNGIEDTSFDYTGYSNNIYHDKYAWIKSLPNNKLLIITKTYNNGDNGQLSSQIINILNPSGSIDNTFALDYYYQGGEIADILLQNDGKYVIIGNRYTSEYNQISYCGRLNSDGSTDVYFGNLGFVSLPNYYYSKAFSGVIQPDGKILIIAYKSNDYNGNQNIYTARFNPNGTPDVTYGSNGIVIKPEIVQYQSNLGLFLDANQNIFIVYNKAYMTDNKKINIDKLSNTGSLIATFQKEISHYRNYFIGFTQTQSGDIIFLTKTHTFNFLSLLKTDTNFNNVSTFGNNGIVTMFTDDDDNNTSNLSFIPKNSIVQSNGKILVSGDLGGYFLRRFNDDGTPDALFNNNSKYIAEKVNKIAIEPNNKILVAHNEGIYRLNEDGTLDTAFGTNGYLDTTYSGVSKILVDTNSNIYVITSNNKIYKYTSNGNPYSTFGTAGVITLTVDYNDAILDGETLFIGGNFTTIYQIPFDSQSDFAITKILPNGTIDTTFGTNGTGTVITSFSISSSESLLKLYLTNDQKLIALGNNYANTVIAKYNLDGTLDTSYGILGKNIIPQGQTIDAVIHPDNSISVLGYSDYSYGATNISFKLKRIATNGWLDNFFGDNGAIITDFDTTPNTSNYPANMLLQPDGKLIVVGKNNNLLLARYNNNLLTDNSTFDTSTSNVKVYPNPFVDKLNIEFFNKTNSNFLNYTIYDITGKTIFKSQKKISFGLNTITLNLSENIKKGYYLLNLEADSYSETIKLVK